MVIDIEKPSFAGVAQYKADRGRPTGRRVRFARVGAAVNFVGGDARRTLIKVRLLAML